MLLSTLNVFNVSIAQSRQTSFQRQFVASASRPPVVSIAQSRQTSFQHVLKLLEQQLERAKFQSPNRVKPLSNGEAVPRLSGLLHKFQSPNRVKPLSNLARQVQRMLGVSVFQSPNRVKPLSNVTDIFRQFSGLQGFNRPIASNLFPTLIIVTLHRY